MSNLIDFIGNRMLANNVLSELKTVDGPGSGLDADLLDGHSLNANGIPLLEGYEVSGKIVNDDTDLNTLSVNSVHNIDGSNTANSPETNWGFVITYIHSNFVAGSNAWRSQVFIGMQSNNIYMRYGNPNNTWTSWVKLWNSSNDGSGSGLDADLLDGVQLSAIAKKTDYSTPTVGGTIKSRISGSNLYITTNGANA